jgi:hypothetical protein
VDPLQLSAEVSATTRTKRDTGDGRCMAQGGYNGLPRSAVDACVAPQNPQVRGAAASPTRIPWTKRHYAAHGGMAASMVPLALDKPFVQVKWVDDIHSSG